MNSALEKLMYAHIKKSVFGKLGALKNEFFDVKGLTHVEREELAKQLLDMMEKATKEFFTEMNRRIEKEYQSNSVSA